MPTYSVKFQKGAVFVEAETAAEAKVLALDWAINRGVLPPHILCVMSADVPERSCVDLLEMMDRDSWLTP